MSQTPELGWIVLSLIGAFGLVQVLHALAIRVRNELGIHDLHVRAADLAAANYRATMLRHGVERVTGEPEEVIEVGETLDEATTIAPTDDQAVPEAQPEPARQAA